VGTRTSGSEGGGEQTTARKRGTAARLRPYIEIVREHARNVKHWQGGDMRLRWAAAGMLTAQAQFRRVKGYRQLPLLAAALRQAVGVENPTAEPSARDRMITQEAATKFHGQRVILLRSACWL
jgi:hypothetical protein